MYEKLNECPVCSSDNIKNDIVVTDFTVSKESFVIMQCDNCQFKFTNPRPSKENINTYYQSEDYISHTNKGNNPINILYKLVRKYSTAMKIKLVENVSRKKNGKILDFGAGTGYFLNEIQKKGWKISGIEPDNKARKIASATTNTTIEDNLEKLLITKEKYDVITLWHVLEHVHNLNEVFIQLKSILKEKGKMLIAVPNIDSYDSKYYKEFWAAYDVPRHLYHFNQESMKTFVMKHGMKIKKVYPMKFDSYYISLLSENNKHKSTNYINSFLTGFKSNSYANKSKNNYSSLIYEIKK